MEKYLPVAGLEALYRTQCGCTEEASRLVELLTREERIDLLDALEVLTEVIWAVQEDETD